jgi:hypothetical protein
LPHLFLISIYYIKGGISELWQYFYLPNLAFGNDGLVNASDLILPLGIPAFFFAISLVLLNRESRFTKYQSQLLQAMFFWTIFSLLQVLYSKALRPHSFIPVMIGLSFFISHFFLIVMRRRFAEMSFWIFLAGIAGVSYYVRYGNNFESTYKNLLVPDVRHQHLQGKKILVLADSLPLYQGNRMTTPFLDWTLAEDIFRHPEYYENIIQVYQGFVEKPDLIIDPENLMKPFLETIPDLRRIYSKSPEGYRLINR